jgi:hypothetical protein
MMESKSKMRELMHRMHWNPDRQFSFLNGFVLVVLFPSRVVSIDLMSADQHKQIRILRGATSVNMKAVLLSKIKTLQDRSEFFKPVAVLNRVKTNVSCPYLANFLIRFVKYS